MIYKAVKVSKIKRRTFPEEGYILRNNLMPRSFIPSFFSLNRGYISQTLRTYSYVSMS
jgi:hypothetical protein